MQACVEKSYYRSRLFHNLAVTCNKEKRRNTLEITEIIEWMKEIRIVRKLVIRTRCTALEGERKGDVELETRNEVTEISGKSLKGRGRRTLRIKKKRRR